MCLAIPSRVVSIDENLQGVVDVMGVTRTASFDLTPQVQVGDYVLLHAGFAIEIVDQQYAEETLELIQDMADMLDDPLLNPNAEGALA